MRKFYSTLGLALCMGVAVAAPTVKKANLISPSQISFDATKVYTPAKTMAKKPAKAPSFNDFCTNYAWVGLDGLDIQGKYDGYTMGDIVMYPAEKDGDVYIFGINTGSSAPVTGNLDLSVGILSIPSNQLLSQVEEDGETYELRFMHYEWVFSSDGTSATPEFRSAPMEGTIYAYEDGGYYIDFPFYDGFAVELQQAGQTIGYYCFFYGSSWQMREAELDSTGWTPAGTATVNDMWFDALVEYNSDQVVGQYTVPYETFDENPNLIRLVDPYGPNTPYADSNLSKVQGSILFNIEETEAVEVRRCYDALLGYAIGEDGEPDPNEPVYAQMANYSGLMLTDGAYYPGNMVGYYRYDGFDYDMIIEFLENRSVMVDNTITVNDPIWSMSWYLHEDTEGLFEPNDMGTPTITLNQGAGVNGINLDDSNAPVKYYNIQGVEIINPAKGQIVIKKQGSKTTKFIAQ